MSYYNKYLKYKNKYLNYKNQNLNYKNQIGGSNFTENKFELKIVNVFSYEPRFNNFLIDIYFYDNNSIPAELEIAHCDKTAIYVAFVTFYSANNGGYSINWNLKSKQKNNEWNQNNQIILNNYKKMNEDNIITLAKQSFNSNYGHLMLFNEEKFIFKEKFKLKIINVFSEEPRPDRYLIDIYFYDNNPIPDELEIAHYNKIYTYVAYVTFSFNYNHRHSSISWNLKSKQKNNEWNQHNEETLNNYKRINQNDINTLAKELFNSKYGHLNPPNIN